jgi:23S rRNA (cytosine1962-C5)-methyltransferase
MNGSALPFVHWFPTKNRCKKATVLEKLRRAIELRAPVRAAGTNMLRIVDGAGDKMDGIEIDDFASRWLVQTRDAAFPDWLRGATEARAIYWKRLGEQKEPPQWIAGEKIEAPFEATENGMHFQIDFSTGYSQGIFLDQRDNRAALRSRASLNAPTNRWRVLNCFAYTCAFGVAAALGGADTVNLDLSKRYLDWGRRNYELNNIDPAAHEFIYGDVINWLNRFAKKGRKFDCVILDPPTFSRDKDGKVFTIEYGFTDLVRAACILLEKDGQLFCSTNQRNLTTESFGQLITAGLEEPRRWKITLSPMPQDFTGEQYLKACWISK